MNRFSTAMMLAAGLAVPLQVAAEERLDEVVVTAKRRTADAADVSSATAVITGAAVESARLVTDALAAAPGVFLQQTTPGQGAAIVRGLKGSAVLHLVDGMRLNNAIVRSAPTQYLALVPVGAIDRIEVVRGTPAALYGSDAVGGVVHVVTHRPRFEGDEPAVHGHSVAGFDTAELARTVRTTIDAGTRRFAASLSAEYVATGNRRVGGGERIGPSGYESTGARLLLEHRAGAGDSWSLDLHWVDQPATPRVDELVAGFGQSEPSAAEFLFAPNRRVFAHGRHHDAAGLLGLDWTFDIAWQRVVDDRVTRDFGAGERQFEQNASDLYGSMVNAVGGDGGFTWLVGAEFYYDQVHSARFEQPDGGLRVPVAARFPDGSAVRQAAVFGSADRRVAARHLLSAGLRYSHVAVELAATELTDAGSLDTGDVSGDLGWVFDSSDTVQVVANAGFGFRAPNVFDLGTLGNRPGNRFNIPNPELASEHVVQADLGLRRTGGRWRFELVGFALRYADRITTVATGATTADGRDIVQSVNAARTTIRGIEAGFSVALTDALTLDGVLNHARGVQRVAGSGEEPADRMPPLNGRLRLGRDDGDGWRISAALAFAAGQDRLSARDAGDSRIDPAGTAGWASLDLAAERTVGADWRIGIELGNAFDRRFRWHGSGLDAPGRNLALTIRRDWSG